MTVSIISFVSEVLHLMCSVRCILWGKRFDAVNKQMILILCIIFVYYCFIFRKDLIR